MRLIQATSPVVVSGAIGKSSGFRINASKEAFRILSSGLYTNKVRAIVRELCCNAYDAHIAAGRADMPFHLHLPTAFEPYFEVKDFGTGLRYITGGCEACKGIGYFTRQEIIEREVIEQEFIVDEIMSGEIEKAQSVIEARDDCEACGGSGDYDAAKVLYCTYFASDKNTSNDFIGGLGVGSKSPFCYTEGFSIVNRYEGVTRIYSCYLDHEALPTLLLQSKEETPEALNGLTVNFPVNQDDVWEFENQAKVALEFFDPLPQVNLPAFKPRTAQYSVRTPLWGLRKGEGKPRAIQGMVQYGIGEIDESRLNDTQRQLRNIPLDLFFPIGELSVAANRESLSNDEATIQNVLSALADVKDGLLQDAKRRVAASRTYWDARLEIFGLSNTAGIGPMIAAALKAGEFDKINPRFSLSDRQLIINSFDYPKIDIHSFSRKSKRGSYAIRKEQLTSTSVHHRDNDQINVEFEITRGAMFVINDTGRGSDKYVRCLINNRSNTTAYLITRKSPEVSWDEVVDESITILDRIGNPPFRLLSELEAEFKELYFSERTYKAPRRILQFSRSSNWRTSWIDKTDMEDDGEVKYYLPIKSLEPVTPVPFGPRELEDFYDSLVGAGLLGFEKGMAIYGIPANRVRTLDDSWVNFWDHISISFADAITPQIERQLAISYGEVEAHIQHERFLRWAAKSNSPVSSPAIRELGKQLLELRENATKLRILTDTITTARRWQFFDRKIEPLDLYSSWTKIRDAYPIFRLLQGIDNKHDFMLICDYVRMVDEKTEKDSERGETFATPPLPLTGTKEEGTYYAN